MNERMNTFTAISNAKHCDLIEYENKRETRDTPKRLHSCCEMNKNKLSFSADVYTQFFLKRERFSGAMDEFFLRLLCCWRYSTGWKHERVSEMQHCMLRWWKATLLSRSGVPVATLLNRVSAAVLKNNSRTHASTHAHTLADAISPRILYNIYFHAAEACRCHSEFRLNIRKSVFRTLQHGISHFFFLVPTLYSRIDFPIVWILFLEQTSVLRTTVPVDCIVSRS